MHTKCSIRSFLKISDGLRIAFFGTDSFSVEALSRVIASGKRNPGMISSLDVITRSIKPQGRKREFVDVPIGIYAGNHNISIHRADTNKEIMDITSEIGPNMAIAVSYGKLIPAELLNNLKFGGLNVHPSLLPKYSGSSPIQYTLMNDDKKTGVTVQTLHPSKFDRGAIIAQSEEQNIEETDNYHTLLNKLGIIGSDLLVEVLEKQLYLQSHTNIEHLNYEFSLAPKILPSASQIKWDEHTNRQIKRLNDALGPLHTFKRCNLLRKKKSIEELHKVILEDIGSCNSIYDRKEPGTFHSGTGNDNNQLIVHTKEGAVSVGKIKMQYCSYEDPITFMSNIQKRSGNTDLKFSIN